MKKVLLTAAAIAAGIFLLCLPVFADQIADNIKVGDNLSIYYRQYPYTGVAEGPFEIWDNTTNAGFLTFCVESQELFHPTNYWGDQYSASDISYSVIKDLDSNLKTLSLQAAYLFYQYRLGNFDSLLFINNVPNVSVFNDLQYAIWFWEQEAGGADNQFGTSFFSNVSTAQLNEAYQHVRVLNPQYIAGDHAPAGTEAQSFLTIVKTPEPETLILLGCGLIGLGFANRRKSKNGRRLEP